MKKSPYILVIDSGLGGLHILAKCKKLTPSSNFLYIADDKNLPYGSKSKNQIENAIYSIYARFKKYYKISCIVIACNTATACAINSLRQKINIPIIGTEPNTKTPTSLNYKNIIVLATPTTAESARFKRLLNNNCNVLICKNLATEIENCFLLNAKIDYTSLFNQIVSKNADCIVLGCTHYNFIEKKLQSLNLPIFDSLIGVAKQVRLLSKPTNIKNGKTIILTTSQNQTKQNKYLKYYKQLLLQ